MSFPLVIDSTIEGAISFSSTRVIDWTPGILERLRLIAHVFGSALGRKRRRAADCQRTARIDAVSRQDMEALQQYSAPGNIRELRNVVERSMILANGRQQTISLPVATGRRAESRTPKLTDVEKEHIRAVLESAGWRVRGTGGAAERLGMRPTTLETRMAKLGLTRPRPDERSCFSPQDQRFSPSSRSRSERSP